MVSATEERRSTPRFPLELELICGRLKGGRVRKAKSGRTKNLSSQGVLFTSDEPYEIGAMLWLSIAWPASRDGERVELSILGRVLRSDSEGTALAIKRHDFHSWREPSMGMIVLGRPGATGRQIYDLSRHIRSNCHHTHPSIQCSGSYGVRAACKPAKQDDSWGDPPDAPGLTRRPLRSKNR